MTSSLIADSNSANAKYDENSRRISCRNAVNGQGRYRNRARSRKCFGGICVGDTEQKEQCMDSKCPSWAIWSDWSAYQTRDRSCLYSTSSKSCEGKSSEFQDCAIAPCPFWAQWADWTPCSATCDGGRRRQSRGCMHGPGCEGGSSKAFKIEQCNTDSCSNWSKWSEFYSCSQSCGGGVQKRYRSCEGGDDCDGKSMESNSCNENSCPSWSDYSNWSSCSASCGEGVKLKQRTCENGDDCFGESSISANCNLGPCPEWQAWSKFSACSKSCGGGVSTRSRKCADGVESVDCLGPAEEQIACNEDKCSEWTKWTEYSSCSVSCGGGSRTATRICQNGDSCEGRSERNQPCGENACPTWSSWTAFGECSVTCGLGEKVRGRTCKHGDDCSGSKIETAYCELAKCGPVYSEWTAWSKLGDTNFFLLL
ncbi:unnamed protein product [Oikopleura dioica]|uniref:Hemicentin-1 n=1 Tax=Oikopleura dioica TaxID=34765 RepID=E4XXM7_OIKDI|nr:unnamed protein product [Oikopleura dioica]